MHRFKRIGLLLDLASESSTSIKSAVELAKSNQGNIFVIIATRDPITRDIQHTIKEKLNALIPTPHSFAFLEGLPIHRVSAYVKANSLDIIITEPDHTEGLTRFFYGSLTLSMLRKTPCPIWVTKNQNHDNKYKKVLACIDPNSDNEDKLALNQKLIEIASSFAKREGAECHIMTAWHYYGESSIKGPFINMPEDKVNELVTNYKIKVTRAFEQLQKDNQALLHGCTTHLVHGQPQKLIPEFIRENNIDIVIMGTLCRTGVQGFLIGNTAESIINQLECSIIAIKPDGFESPLL